LTSRLFSSGSESSANSGTLCWASDRAVAPSSADIPADADMQAREQLGSKGHVDLHPLKRAKKTSQNNT